MGRAEKEEGPEGEAEGWPPKGKGGGGRKEEENDNDDEAAREE